MQSEITLAANASTASVLSTHSFHQRPAQTSGAGWRQTASPLAVTCGFFWQTRVGSSMMTHLFDQHRRFNDRNARLPALPPRNGTNHSGPSLKATKQVPRRNPTQFVLLLLLQSQPGDDIVQNFKLVTFCLSLASNLTEPNPPRLQTKVISRSVKEQPLDEI